MCKSTLKFVTGFFGAIVFQASFHHGLTAQSNLAIKDSTQVAVIQSIQTRFESDSPSELPDFQKHVIPLLGKLGCNGRACHGSFQGRGGFQLSLFGYDFAADHAAMMDESTGRIDLNDVDESLVLAKPLDADLHEGGQRFEKGSWEHHILRNWIASGAINHSNPPQLLNRLEVVPSEIEFKKHDPSVELKVLAHWEDGTVEDVTILCRFKSNDDAIATVSQQGEVCQGESGDTHVVVSYDNAVIPVPVIRPFHSKNKSTNTRSSHRIDELVDRKLKQLNIQASGLCTDAEFIRRVSLDITGILPSPKRVEEFLEDNYPNKRDLLIEELLQSEGYAAWWATRFSDWTGNSDEQLNNVLPVRNSATRMWYEWLRQRIKNNVPYDQIVEGIVTASSRNQNETYLDYCKAMTDASQPGQESKFADREGMPLYWARRNFQTPEDRAIGFSYTFLGVRIECAQCHKHPFDQWSKDDFERFSKLFAPIRVNQNLVEQDAKAERDRLLADLTGDKTLRGNDLRKVLYQAARKGETIPFGELLVNVRPLTSKQQQAIALAKKQGRKVRTPIVPSGKILGESDEIRLDHDPRQELMSWLRDPNNPYFAKAIINRVWSNYFGIGIVDPTDDLNLANPPSNGPLMNYLATSFIANDFDLKWLHRTITTSDTYQRSVEVNDSNLLDRKNFARHIPRRLPAEVVYDSVVLATGSDQQAETLRAEVDSMAIADGKPLRRNQQDFALEVFGQSIRESNCDCDRSDAPSLLQSVYLRNDTEMHQRLADSRGWVSQACKAIGVDPPGNDNESQERTNYNRANTIRKQILNQLSRIKKASEQQQAKYKKQFEAEFERHVKKLSTLGYQAPTLSQLMAGQETWQILEKQIPKTGTLTDIKELVKQAYLRTLSRYPDSEEEQISIAYIENSQTPSEGVSSLVWALVNTKEFIVTH
ncbi:DUF1549 and DUF1553 domain-containing protein [Rhodopirellula sp.]|nr:DUF1549 and DUF1553 domain-containing protein [Rhodopirellula sp.]